jgi:nicotinate-nucleotide--dimethylbenzimidazole phosphoribosyltransferase
MLDGFVATSAVLPLARLNACALDHRRQATFQPNPATVTLLNELKLDPLLDLGMRFGAGVAILLARTALACRAGMATFVEAGVAGAGIDETLPHIPA